MMSNTSTITIRDAIDAILVAAAAEPLVDTVDTVKFGDATQPLTGVVTTFLATGAVIGSAWTSGTTRHLPLPREDDMMRKPGLSTASRKPRRC
jgi:hypothetical protein